MEQSNLSPYQPHARAHVNPMSHEPMSTPCKRINYLTQFSEVKKGNFHNDFLFNSYSLISFQYGNLFYKINTFLFLPDVMVGGINHSSADCPASSSGLPDQNPSTASSIDLL